MLGGACELQDFQKRILQLAPELIKQLFDLRSQIPKEAANVICLLARKNYQNMKKITEILISKTALLKVISSATRVIADNGHRSVCTILSHVYNKKVIQNIAEELHYCKNQKAIIRMSEYILIIVTKFPE